MTMSSFHCVINVIKCLLLRCSGSSFSSPWRAVWHFPLISVWQPSHTAITVWYMGRILSCESSEYCVVAFIPFFFSFFFQTQWTEISEKESKISEFITSDCCGLYQKLHTAVGLRLKQRPKRQREQLCKGWTLFDVNIQRSLAHAYLIIQLHRDQDHRDIQTYDFIKES